MVIALITKSMFSTFAIILLGFFAGKLKLLGENSVNTLNKFVCYFSMPAILFVAMANAPVSQSINLPFIYALMLSSFILYFIGIISSKLFFKPNTIELASMRALTISSANVAFMGIPVLISLFGEQSLLPIAVATVLLTLLMAITIFILEISNHKNNSKKPIAIIFKISTNTLRNPMMVAPILGILFATTGWKLPDFINTCGHQLGATAGPCALFAIGQTLVGSKIFSKKFEFFFVSFGKLLLQPFLMLIFIFVFHVTPLWAACGVILSALPCAAVSYIVASQYKIYELRASALVFETTIFSLVTVSIAIAVVSHFWPNMLLN